MIFGNLRQRLSLLALAVVGLVLLPGCDPDPYPADLRYPVRTDLLVEEAVGEGILETFGPGQLDVFIGSLKQKQEAGTPGFKVLDPSGLSDEQRKKIRGVLHNQFGTPAAPRLYLEETDFEDPGLIDELQLQGPVLSKGSTLYRRHCLHCHGVAGDGRGPTAPWINPPPRDFRRGAFKFTSVKPSPGKSKPMRADLVRTLREGIEGTAMPNFKYMKDAELNALVSYVMHLSVRGMVEFTVIDETLKQSPNVDRLADRVRERMNTALEEWKTAAIPLDVVDYPASYLTKDSTKDDEKKYQESVARGYKLFIGKGICITCHTDFGRQATFRYDIWGTLVRPNNLTQGVYRGGNRPIDLYYRIAGGIRPAPSPEGMPAFVGSAEETWDLVNFVRALPYPAMLPEEVRSKVYGAARK